MRSSASVSAPEPTPDSSTRAPGNRSARMRIGPRSFGIDHLSAAGHLEHVFRERGTDRGEAGVLRGAHRGAVGLADDVVVRQHPGVRVELTAVGERHQMASALGVDQEDPVTRAEGACHVLASVSDG